MWRAKSFKFVGIVGSLTGSIEYLVHEGINKVSSSNMYSM